jgi:hypothetical protein
MMNPQQKEFLVYLQTCRIPELIEGKLSEEKERREFASELQDAFTILTSLQDRCVAQTQELEVAERLIRKLKSQCR